MGKPHPARVLFITCSDSRVAPSRLMQSTHPGELYLFRTPGPLLPEIIPATIQHALEDLAIPTIVLCGHSLCAAATKGDLLTQLERLRNYPPVAKRLAQGNLSVHAWFHDLTTGGLEAFDPTSGSFLAIPEGTPPIPAASPLALQR